MSEQPGASPKPELGYAPAPPWHRRRRTRNIGLLIAFALLAGALAIWMPRWIRHVQILYWERQCRNYVAPSDAVVYRSEGGTPTQPVVARCWTRLEALVGRRALPSQGTLFVHERRSPSGNRRLVVIELMPFFQGMLIADCRLFHPASGIYSTLEVANAHCSTRPFLPGQNTRIYAGQVDANDASHFTIEFEMDGQVQVFDGWLRDGDSVLLEPRLQPEKPASSTMPARSASP